RVLDKRFSITFLSILDPESYGLPPERVESILELKKLEDSVYLELASIANRLQKLGYETNVKLKTGSFNSILISELESEDNDAVVFIKRKLFKKDFKKDFDESTILYVTSKYPGKVMVLRRD
ncbi:MAG: hypothetical protein QW327_06805, partial [Candidatus Odinarchaeota archaeon]